MHTDIAWLDLANRRRSLLGYCLGMAVYALVVVAMYPAFKTSTSLDKLIQADSTAAALFGVTGRISSSGGWLNGNIYTNFFPSLFYWSVGNSQISHGVSPADYAVLIITGLCALTAAMLAFRRLDIH
jgi:hypothetical protein